MREQAANLRGFYTNHFHESQILIQNFNTFNVVHIMIIYITYKSTLAESSVEILKFNV